MGVSLPGHQQETRDKTFLLTHKASHRYTHNWPICMCTMRGFMPSVTSSCVQLYHFPATINKVMSSEELKEKGNACVKSENYAEAILHYTHALQLDNANAALHSNRSLAFLKMHQYYYALQDADTAISLNPQWAKGYYRKGEVEFATSQFQDALTSYTQAFVLEKQDPMLMECLKKAARELKRDNTVELQIPWVGAGIGIIMGVTLVLADRLLYEIPTVRNPMSMVGLTLLAALLGFACCKCYRLYIKRERALLLNPPVDLLGESQEEQELPEVTEKPTQREYTRHTKAQARRRYQKGKL